MKELTKEQEWEDFQEYAKKEGFDLRLDEEGWEFLFSESNTARDSFSAGWKAVLKRLGSIL